MIINLQIPWPARKIGDKPAPATSLSERLDRYVTNLSRPEAEPTQRERMDYRARVETALDRF